MKKAESTLLNMILVLCVITAISGVALGYINELTKGPKEQMRLKRQLEAIQSVMTGFTNNPTESTLKFPVEGSKDSLEFFIGEKEGDWSGVAVSTFTNKGYSGLIRMMVGFDTDGKIGDVVVLKQKETPGLGTKIKDNKFKSQFPGIDPSETLLKVEKDGGEINAITGATISSRAFCEATQLAYDTFMENKEIIQKVVE